MENRQRYFDPSVSWHFLSTVFSAAEHQPLYKKYFEKNDVQFRKFIRRNVAPALGTNWSARWHDILHRWNLMWVDHPLHCNFFCRMLGDESTCVVNAPNISNPRTPKSRLGHQTGQFFARNAIRWGVLLSFFLARKKSVREDCFTGQPRRGHFFVANEN